MLLHTFSVKEKVSALLWKKNVKSVFIFSAKMSTTFKSTILDEINFLFSERYCLPQKKTKNTKKTRKFEWTLGDIKIKNIISAPIIFLEVSPLLDVTLYQAAILCNIKET